MGEEEIAGANSFTAAQPEVNPKEETKPAKNSAPSTVSDTFTAADDPGCSGEPCPVDSHCRSRYGSCGPGFIYCNIYSIWKRTCPPVIPGTRPTRSPTARPTG